MEYPSVPRHIGQTPHYLFYVDVQCVAEPRMLLQNQLQSNPIGSAVDCGRIECPWSSFWVHVLSPHADIKHDTDSRWEMLPSSKSRSSSRKWKCIFVVHCRKYRCLQATSLKPNATGNKRRSSQLLTVLFEPYVVSYFFDGDSLLYISVQHLADKVQALLGERKIRGS